MTDPVSDSVHSTRTMSGAMTSSRQEHLMAGPFGYWLFLDEYTRECLAMLVARHITSGDVIEQLYECFSSREFLKLNYL